MTNYIVFRVMDGVRLATARPELIKTLKAGGVRFERFTANCWAAAQTFAELWGELG